MKISLLIFAALAAWTACAQSARLGALGRNDMVVTNIIHQSLAPSTNYTDAATNALAQGMAKADRITDGTNTIDSARNVYAPIVGTNDNTWTYKTVPPGYEDRLLSTGLTVEWDADGTYTSGIGGWYVINGSLRFGHDPAAFRFEYDAWDYELLQNLHIIATRKDHIVGKLALTNDVPDVSGISSAVNSWEAYWGGSNVTFEVTNYYGNTSGELPRLRTRELIGGVWQTVWDEVNKFNVCESNILSHVAASNTALLAEVQSKYLGKAWGAYTDKGTTNVVGNSVWMTAPETYFAGGTEYQRVAVGSGSICVLTDNGALAKTAGEPGTFRFQDEGGTNYFGFSKSDSYTIGCNTDGITVSGNLVTLRYDVIMSGADVPIVYYKQTLDAATWTQLNNSDGTAADGAPYTVTWYTSGGSYYAAINCGSNASGFFRAETSVSGDVVFETNMKARLGGGIECVNTQTGVLGVIRPSFNGSSVTWTWSAK